MDRLDQVERRSVGDAVDNGVNDITFVVDSPLLDKKESEGGQESHMYADSHGEWIWLRYSQWWESTGCGGCCQDIVGRARIFLSRKRVC